MTIVGLGMDLAQIARFEAAHARHGERLLARLFTAREREYCERRKDRLSSYCGRFAVKEAVMKVLGTGWARGVRWIDIEVVREPGSAPVCVLHGTAGMIARRKGIGRIHVTITHDAGIAAAVAVAETEDKQ
jgi:holo-[acyl-carrier protein] synthase